MTWREVKVAALQKMFAVPGDEALQNEGTRQYLAAMPQAANEGMARAVGAGKGGIKVLKIEHAPGPQSGSVMRYDVRALAEDFYRLKEDGMSLEHKGRLRQNPPYGWEGQGTLVLMSAKPGLYRVPYYVAAPRVSGQTPDDHELPLPEEVCLLLPLYVASALYKDDDLALATMYRNEFEAGLEMVYEAGQAPTGDVFECESGWI